METTPAVEQAECEECDNDEFSVIGRSYEMTPEDTEDAHTTRTVKCDDCGATGDVIVDFNGTHATGCVSFENASWNQEDEEESDNDG